MLENTQPAAAQHSARVDILASGTGSVTIAGRTVPLRGGDVAGARRQALEMLVAAAQQAGAPLLTVSHEPDNTWRLSVHPDGTVSAADALRTGPGTPETPSTQPAPEAPGPEALELPEAVLPPIPRATVEEPEAPSQHTAPAPVYQAPPPTPAPPQPDTTQPAPPATAETSEELRAQARQTSLLVESTTQLPARQGWRGALNLLGLHLSPSPTERAARDDVEAVSQHWPGPRTIAVVNGKGGAGKTPTTVLLAAVLARNGGAGVIAWDNNPTRGTLGWRTLQGPHSSSVEDLLPHVEHLLSPTAQAAELAAFVHHQPHDRFDVLRSRPEVLANAQPTDATAFNSVHDVLAKYYRLILIDSGNDESAPQWRAMIDRADAIVVPTTTRPEHAESARLLLDELARTDAHCAHLAANALVIVSQASKAEPTPEHLVSAFRTITRASTGIPYDPAMSGRPLLLESLAPSTQRAWLAGASALAAGLH